MDNIFNAIKLDKNIPIPLYYQLKKQILSLIENAAIQEGGMLPPENELCEVLNVSRPTIRQALSELVNEGYLSRYKGKGTFVSNPKVEERFLSKLETFNQEMISKGLTPQTKVIKLEKITGPHEANEKLALPLNAPLIYLGRLRLADGVPLVYVETFLPYEQYPKLMEVDFTVNSLYQSLEDLYHVRVNRVRREIEAINARHKEAELLQITKNKALILVRTVASSDDAPMPVEFSIARYRGDRNKFSVDILGYYYS
ncbi:MAG: GntR family transcriptional regulator [Spirochaetaceae bacterium]|jgi:GntR family transcriptional regulator|nr:GntR family transcriptional regulator [Spirochaetaceae bacterium]